MKCETGLHGRSPDRNARVCNLCENGDYIQDENHARDFFMYGHQTFTAQVQPINKISKGDIKGFVIQHNSEVHKFSSAAVNLFN